MNAMAETPPDGIYRGIPFDEYLGWDAVSNSALSRFARVPAAAWVPLEDSPALAIGRAVHCAALEPNRFPTAYRPKQFHGSTKDGKAEAAAALESGMNLLARAEWDDVSGMADAVRSHPAAAALLADGEAEASLLWTDAETGLRCKARVDWLAPDFAVDLKTTKDSSPSAFAKSIANFRYHVQQAHYRTGLESLGIPNDGFFFIAVDKTAPYPVGCYCITDAAEAVGFRLRQRGLRAWKKCVESGIWPAWRSPSIETLPLPAWAMIEEEKAE